MMEFLSILRSIFSLDTLIYVAILMVFLASVGRCLMPLGSMARRLRRAARIIITENKQNKEKKSWNDLNFLGDRMQGTWADFLQNAELRDAHGESCDVTQYINEDTVIYAMGGARLADMTPGILTSLGILGTFLGLVLGLSGLNLNAADTSALLSAMEQLIGGMSTAFLTSNLRNKLLRCVSTVLTETWSISAISFVCIPEYMPFNTSISLFVSKDW